MNCFQYIHDSIIRSSDLCSLGRLPEHFHNEGCRFAYICIGQPMKFSVQLKSNELLGSHHYVGDIETVGNNEDDASRL
jgi:hypothetical protein